MTRINVVASQSFKIKEYISRLSYIIICYLFTIYNYYLLPIINHIIDNSRFNHQVLPKYLLLIKNIFQNYF